MPDETDDQWLARTLRDLRTRRGLGLKRVAAASRRLASDSAGEISHSYLSQLERGLVSNVSLPKLLTLAALYGVDVRDFLDDAPAAQRDRIAGELEEWRAAGRPVPNPINYFTPSAVKGAVDSKIDGLLSARAESVSIPLKREDVARVIIRSAAADAAILPYLGHTKSDVPKLFWASHEQFIVRVLRGKGEPASRGWNDVLNELERWLLYDLDVVDQLFRPIDRWSFDFAHDLVSFHFTEPSVECRFGFDRLPFSAFSQVRRLEVARHLAAKLPRSAKLPDPPDPIEGARAYINDLLSPDRLDPNHPPGPPIGTVVKTVTELAKRVPTLSGQTVHDQSVLDNVAAFLHSATTTEQARRKPRRQR